MRVMVMVKATKNSESGAMPTEDDFAQMGAFNEELVKAGVMVAGDGLLPSSRGVRVHFDQDRRTVSQGPFADPGSLVAGFWIWKVKDMDEAIEWARRCPNPMPGEPSDLELRPIAEFEDFGDAMTPELREQEQRLRATTQNP